MDILLASKLLGQLAENNGIWIALLETVCMTLLSTFFAYLIGMPLGVVLVLTDKGGPAPLPWVNKLLGMAVNIFRSIPFIILMVVLIPFSRALLGTSIGDAPMVLMLVVAAAPYVARMVESSLKEVDKGVIEAARSMGAGVWKIVFKVYIPEAKPSLIVGAVISMVTVLGYTAMAGTISAGGLGSLAVTTARPSNARDVIWICVVLVVILVQIIQELGMFIARFTDKRVHPPKKIKNK